MMMMSVMMMIGSTVNCGFPPGKEHMGNKMDSELWQRWRARVEYKRRGGRRRGKRNVKDRDRRHVSAARSEGAERKIAEECIECIGRTPILLHIDMRKLDWVERPNPVLPHKGRSPPRERKTRLK